MPWSY